VAVAEIVPPMVITSPADRHGVDGPSDTEPRYSVPGCGGAQLLKTFSFSTGFDIECSSSVGPIGGSTTRPLGARQ